MLHTACVAHNEYNAQITHTPHFINTELIKHTVHIHVYHYTMNILFFVNLAAVIFQDQVKVTTLSICLKQPRNTGTDVSSSTTEALGAPRSR